MFTKKHYVKVAQVIRESKDRVELIDRLCKLFQEDNPKFNQDRFVNACMDTETKAKIQDKVDLSDMQQIEFGFTGRQ